MKACVTNLLYKANDVWFLGILAALALFFSHCLQVSAESSELKIVVENYSDSDVVHFPVVLLRGRVDGVENGTIIVEDLSSSLDSRITRSEVYRGRFKIPVELTAGSNRLSIATGDARIDFTLIYRKSANRRFVRLIFFSDSSGSDVVDTPKEWLIGRDAAFNASGDYVRKMRTAARLWQTATAERLFDAGYGRRTFALETDDNGQVVVWKQRGKKTKEEYCALSELERFHEVYHEVISGPAYSKDACYFVLISFGGQGEEFGENQGRVALGADNIAMLDSSSLFSWPSSLSEAIVFFQDETGISDVYAKDSAYRNVRWALTSSALGAGLHELGHAFGLSHSDDPNDFMSRGFDRFNRIFTMYEPSSSVSQGGIFEDDDIVEWTASTAPKLIRSLWIEE